MVIRAHTHGASVVLFACIYLADGAAFILGQHCGLLESVYREVEWAVLSNDLFFFMFKNIEYKLIILFNFF